jgi:hypothetical protein
LRAFGGEFPTAVPVWVAKLEQLPDEYLIQTAAQWLVLLLPQFNVQLIVLLAQFVRLPDRHPQVPHARDSEYDDSTTFNATVH